MNIAAKVFLAALFVVIAAGLPGRGIAASLAVKPEVALSQAFPQIKADSIRESEIKGVFEVITGSNIFYFYPDKDLLLVGEIYTKDGRSLTAERKGELAALKIKDLPLTKAVKIGDGPKTVIEFTDPDCPYCRKASEFFKNRTDVTRYVFFSPFAHPAAIKKVYYILAADDKAKAYREMMEGKPLPTPEPAASEAIKALAAEQMELAKKMGVQGTPTFYVNGKQVVGADIQKLESLLK
jgi:thiol:disulfide interchange protein DsbC